MAIGISSGAFERVSEGLYRINFEKGFATARASSGLEKLAFEVVFCLFTTLGSIPQDPEFGTQIRSFIGQALVGPSTEDKLADLLFQEVLRAELLIQSRQSAYGLPVEERLKQIVVDELQVDAKAGKANLRFLVVNDLDQSVGFEIPGINGGT